MNVSVPRLVATDLDGTLVGAGGLVSPHTARVLARLAGAGTAVVLVTGRPLRWLHIVYEQLGAPYLAVCANGAVIYDPVTDKVRDSWTIEPGLLSEMCLRLRAAIPDVLFAVEVDDGRVMRYEPAWPVKWDEGQPGVVPGSLADLTAEPAVKLLARTPGMGPDEFVALAESIVDGEVVPTHSSRTGLVEMSARGVTKATGLATVATELNIDAADVLAFGDMPNDVPMLHWAGRSVAVSNAHPAARAAAREITLSNEDDGVAAYLERFLPAEPDLA
ncbi:HAD family hydrolase [Rugosimonospora africana]|uniref:Haloacid dehalogenase n=1 Tax=Rugosimonospora africana TaxID=556532 RepID=A0A8J3QLB2_9ACTN|nr:HAD family hydrolase [Rugosimonospora africana]GIH13095.1 haloacid dehalogenase [Rugosimonospora africana]